MAVTQYNNTFGAASSVNGIDLQRSDLWRVSIALPAVLAAGVNAWSQNVEFLLEKFPFPERSRESIPVKYMQQTNYLLGKDSDVGAIEIPVRYAFSVPTLQLLEKWNYLCSNPNTGGVGLTSACKGTGRITWLVPNMQAQVSTLNAPANNALNTVANSGVPVLSDGIAYQLEGCIIKGLKFSEASMTESGFVNIMFSLQVDRWYPTSDSWSQNLVVNPTLLT